MKIFLFLLSSFWAATSVARAMEEYTIGSCAELASVDDTTVTTLTITTRFFTCEEYTRFRVRNSLTIKSNGTDVRFVNFAFKVLGDLIVEPDATFDGASMQEKRGGALHVNEGSTVTFMGLTLFFENTVMETELPPITTDSGETVVTYKRRKGGAVHNKGHIVFETNAEFRFNKALTVQPTNVGVGGALSNQESGTIIFKGPLYFDGNVAEGPLGGVGGGIYNSGEIVSEDDSFFTLNEAANGGAIYNDGGKITFNGTPTFTGNTAFENLGGAIVNRKGEIFFNSWSQFVYNNASSFGDGGFGGAIWSNGDVTFMGKTTFISNSALWGGQLFSSGAGTLTFPEDLEDLEFLEIDENINCPKVAIDPTIGGGPLDLWFCGEQ